MLHLVRHDLNKLFSRKIGVEQEGAAILEVFGNIKLEDIRIQRDRDEISVLNVISRMNRSLAESQVRSGDAARLTGIISEVSLAILTSRIADDLAGRLVGADGAIRA